MINSEMARELLTTFTYKPGWHFAVLDGHLRIRVEDVQDTRHPGKTTILNGSFPIPTLISELGFWTWLRQQILTAEAHEMDEWFQVNGDIIFDPHDLDRMRGAMAL